ncbi:hypothetical protein CPB86DRAFT_790371 [Serendipita vermifera]|nr:hypothetical protein CPB86DRAFT_790371 [Serendipita vermifera]
MSVISTTPLEIWQTILRYAISVPIFLDPDSVEGISPFLIDNQDIEWNDEKPYWSSERDRNALQRVCKSWDAYLRHYHHRFVRISDVIHGSVSIEQLKSAIRVSLAEHFEPIVCAMCHPNQILSNDPSSGMTFEDLCWNIIQQAGALQLIILDFRSSGFSMVKFPITAFPKAVTLLGLHCAYSGTLAKIVNSIQTLRHCFGRGYWGPKEKQTLNSSSLISLSLTLRYPTPPEDFFKTQNWNLPNLRHLCARFTDRRDVSDLPQKSLWAMLKIGGKGLHSLYLPWDNRDHNLLADIWTLCPNLELLHTEMKLTSAPPFDHPIRTISVPSFDFYDNKPLETYIPNWPGIRAVRMDVSWYRPVEKLKGFSLRLEDVKGESYDDFLLRHESEAS